MRINLKDFSAKCTLDREPWQLSAELLGYAERALGTLAQMRAESWRISRWKLAVGRWIIY